MSGWSASTLWWLLSLLLVLAELASGSFYLLMLAVGAAVGGLAAWLGAPLALQLAVAALAGGGAVLWLFQRRRRHPKQPAPQANPDLNLDVGQQVQVLAWEADGHATVIHRGASWQARHQGPGAPKPGPHQIVAVEAICLVLRPLP